MSKHVSHNLTLSAGGIESLTVAQVLKSLRKLKVPPNTVIKFPADHGWRTVKSMSFCREAGEVSVW